MSEEVIVTRGSQITLTKEIREKLHVKEGDVVIMNLIGDAVMLSKKDPKVFDNFESFLPDNFEKILNKIRHDEKERLKRIGIIE